MSQLFDYLPKGLADWLKERATAIPSAFPVEIAEHLKGFPDEIRAAELAWNNLYRASAGGKVGKNSMKPLGILIALVGAVALYRILASQAQREPSRERIAIPPSPTPAPVRVALLLVTGADDLDKTLPEIQRGGGSEDFGVKLGRITRWLWQGDVNVAGRFWQEEAKQKSSESNDQREFQIVWIELIQYESAFDSESAMIRAEGFRNLSSRTARYEISGRVSSSVLRGLSFKRL